VNERDLNARGGVDAGDGEGGEEGGQGGADVGSQGDGEGLAQIDALAVDLDTLRGRPWIADLIFTRCPHTCPRMTEMLNALGPGLAAAGGARRVSISVDPGHDSPAVLGQYAERYGIRDPEWLFLTVERGEIQSLARGGFLLPFEDAPDEAAEERVLHSTRFVLVDAEARVRGYYDPFEPGATDRLLRDLQALHRGP